MGNLMNIHVRQEAHPTETETTATHSQACQNGSESECDRLDDWLTVHRSIIFVNFQLDAKNSLFIYVQYIY
jgi:hypothetical protein